MASMSDQTTLFFLLLRAREMKHQVRTRWPRNFPKVTERTRPTDATKQNNILRSAEPRKTPLPHQDPSQTRIARRLLSAAYSTGQGRKHQKSCNTIENRIVSMLYLHVPPWPRSRFRKVRTPFHIALSMLSCNVFVYSACTPPKCHRACSQLAKCKRATRKSSCVRRIQ